MKPTLKIMDVAICRTPAFSPADLLNDNWLQLKEIIGEASNEFYELIKLMDYDQLLKANEKIRFTVWKYYDRARYRPTPFGSFAGISFVPVTASEGPLIVKQEFIKHQFTDWAFEDVISQKEPEWFLSNATYYHIGGEIRYIRISDNVFELATLIEMAEVTAILALCRIKKQRQQIYSRMKQQFGMEPRDTKNLLIQLLQLHLLLSDRSRNITGPDYFKRLQIGSVKPAYIIAERNLVSGGLDPSILDLIPEYFDFLKNMIPQATNRELDKFRRDFSRKFDLRAIPLALALDPEAGVGYGGMATEPDENALDTIFGQSEQKNKDDSFNYTRQHHFLIEGLLKGGEIKLEDYVSKPVENIDPFPNTLSAVITLHNNQVIIESAGGSTANSLLGRFTLVGGEAFKLAKEISEIEADANPGILFFDVAYQAEKKIDNVNRRQQLYENELPLLSWSCVAEPLSLDDLLVMVRQGEIILWSKKYAKRAVPRVASAYNYNRSDLAVYRFLCNLQYQGLSANLTFNFRQFLPGFNHYPRAYYKKLIVSPETWTLDKNLKDVLELRKWLFENHINHLFKCGNADQTLCFDPEKEEDLMAFLTYTKQQNSGVIYITEALSGDTIEGTKGSTYIPQYIVNFFHSRTIYSLPQPPIAQAAAQIFLPGNEWLYLEIYCLPLRSNSLLKDVCELLYKNRLHIKKWFFIRYTDPAPHIRLRLHLKDRSLNGFMLVVINDAIADLFKNGLIAELQVKTYTREYERYGADRMELVETYFYRDSQYIIKLLSRELSMEALQIHTLQLMSRWLQLSGLKDIVSFVQTLANSFGAEFKLDQPAFKQVNKSFEIIKIDLEKYHLSLTGTYESSFVKIVNSCQDEAEKALIAADLIHMHINRVFTTGQRKQEALLYQYLLKWLKIRQFRELTVQAQRSSV